MIISLSLIYFGLKYGYPTVLWGLLITWIPDVVLIGCLLSKDENEPVEVQKR